jgi:iron complex transport system ATP-binding protein
VVDAIVGDVGSGKTTAAARLIAYARESGVCVFGILAPRIMRCQARVGYEVVDASTQTTAPWLELDERMPDIGPFRIVPEGAALARRALTDGLCSQGGIFVIDEIGPLEFRGGGHNWALARLAECRADHILLVARRQVARSFKERWGLEVRCWEPNEWRALAEAYGLHGQPA